jgi:hypothetical protein
MRTKIECDDIQGLTASRRTLCVCVYIYNIHIHNKHARAHTHTHTHTHTHSRTHTHTYTHLRQPAAQAELLASFVAMCTRPPHSCTYHPCHTYSPTNQARKSVLAPDQKRKQKPEKSAPWPNQYRVRQSLKTFFSIFFLICTRKRDMRMSHCTELGYAGSECIVGSLKTGTGSRGGGTNSGSGTCTCVCVCVRVCVCVCVCVCVRVYTHIYTHKCVYIHTYICRGGIGVGCHGMCVYTHTQTHTYTRITSNGG